VRARAREPGLFERVVAAAGIDRGKPPRYWQPPAAEAHVARWRKLGLSDDQSSRSSPNARCATRTNRPEARRHTTQT